jgi:phosphoribosylformylglycinamidine synthase subunit PurL
VCGLVRGVPPVLDLAAERSLQALLVQLAEAHLIRSAHDCSDGGIAITLAECCFDTGGIGARVSIPPARISSNQAMNRTAALFSESASRAVVSVRSDDVSKVLERAATARVPARVLGRTGGQRLQITVGEEIAIDVGLDEAERIWSSAFERYFGKRVA